MSTSLTTMGFQYKEGETLQLLPFQYQPTNPITITELPLGRHFFFSQPPKSYPVDRKRAGKSCGITHVIQRGLCNQAYMLQVTNKHMPAVIAKVFDPTDERHGTESYSADIDVVAADLESNNEFLVYTILRENLANTDEQVCCSKLIGAYTVELVRQEEKLDYVCVLLLSRLPDAIPLSQAPRSAIRIHEKSIRDRIFQTYSWLAKYGIELPD